jgi:hypothetical protein
LWAIVTVTVACLAPDPLSTSCGGETVQVSLAATPLHVNATAPVNPLSGETVSVNVSDRPREIVNADVEDAIAKS